ncbi:ralBP1-associated Eps domain-containing protein 2 [Eleginops maclovinus]|uniref:ralBP1-associated Eps domain-containing protein 2 n=1 Tax=Eleginops maclovinus TaxID=56733 RepID=UPI00308000D2
MMDPDSVCVGSLIPLTEQESQLFSGLHSRCQADPSGSLSSGRVAELFQAAQLPPETLHRVMEVCGAKRLGFFGTPQFFMALKLLAAAQAGLPVQLESLTADLPLPRFLGLKIDPEVRYPVAPPPADGSTGSVTWAPRDLSFRHLEAEGEKKDAWSLPRSPNSSLPRSPLTHHRFPYSQQRNDPPTSYEIRPPLSVHQEQHSSPGGFRSSVEPAVRATAGPPSETEDPWRISEEQLQYYTAQFTGLQPDLGALILGSIAKSFFTKSRLPIPELSHIWELSDVDRDGALCFSEFCTAFHLIVARKNGYPLPDTLPPPLQPSLLLHTQPPPETNCVFLQSAEPLILFQDGPPRIGLTESSISEQTGQPPPLPEWTGLPPPHPELKKEACRQDVQTVKPSQVDQGLQRGGFPRRPEPRQDLDPHLRARTRPRSFSSTSIEEAMKKSEEPPTPPPRPQKTHSRASSLDLNKLFQQGAPGPHTFSGIKSGWLPSPPALPPRPPASQKQRGAEDPHCRIRSSEDLTITSKQELAPPPPQAPQKPIRRKYHPEVQNLEPPPTKPAQRLPSKQKRQIQMLIRKNKETNAVLTRLNSDLQQQLKEVHQDRLTLESQLELRRPLAPT